MNPEVEKAQSASPEPACVDEPWSLIRCVLGHPCKCEPFDSAEITTMEAKYQVSAKIAEFWCFITSIFYGSSLLLYFVKEEDWYPEWRAGWPANIHFSVIMSVMVMLCSAIYHACLLEINYTFRDDYYGARVSICATVIYADEVVLRRCDSNTHPHRSYMFCIGPNGDCAATLGVARVIRVRSGAYVVLCRRKWHGVKCARVRIRSMNQ